MLAPLPSLQDFRLQSYLGSGPFGHVYRARDQHNARDVAIKLLDPRRCTSSGLTRLTVIARRATTSAVARDKQLYEVVADPVRPFVVMDLLPGENLQDLLLRAGPLPWKQARGLGHAIAAALEIAHAAGVVHGAVKPTNIFVHGELVYLTDFGVRALSDPHDPDVLLAEAGRMAPEQLRGEAADERCDVFGLGLVLFELVTGRLPFEGLPREVFKHQLSRRPPAPSSFVPTLPHVADSMILALLAKSPAHRPANASRVRSMLAVPDAHPNERPAPPTTTHASASACGPESPRLVSPARPLAAPVLAAAALVAALAGSLVITCL